MKKILTLFKRNFRLKLILCFITCAVIPILFIGITSYTTSVRIARSKLLESTALSGNQVAKAINDRMAQVENMADLVHFYLYTLNTTPQEPLSGYMSEFSTVRNNISSLMNAFDIFHITVFVDPDTLISKEGLNYLSFADMERYHIDEAELVNLGVSSKWLFSDQISFPHVVTKGKPPTGVLTCCRADPDQSGGYNYIFGIYLTSDELSGVLRESYTDSEINAYIIDDQGIIVAASDLQDIGTAIAADKLEAYRAKAGSDTFTYGNNYAMINAISSDWHLVTEVPDPYIRRNTQVLVQFIIISLFIVVLITIAAIFFISSTLTRKINLLSHTMAQIEYDQITQSAALPPQLLENTDNGDEIDRLSGSFRQMLQALAGSFREILDLSVKEERLNYSLLQSQINPHFLYNILGSIRALLSLKEIDKADRMLFDLSKFYRGMLKKSEDLIPIRDELEIAELYLRMEALCKNDVFTWSIHIDEDIDNFLICKFTLQPILENSIKHGFSVRKDRMHIDIRIVYADDMIEITIHDNGSGIPPQRLAEIHRDLAEKTVRYDKHFGISNINSRISSSLQEHGTISISSEPGEGSTVQILIPQILND